MGWGGVLFFVCFFFLGGGDIQTEPDLKISLALNAGIGSN